MKKRIWGLGLGLVLAILISVPTAVATGESEASAEILPVPEVDIVIPFTFKKTDGIGVSVSQSGQDGTYLIGIENESMVHGFWEIDEFEAWMEAERAANQERVDSGEVCCFAGIVDGDWVWEERAWTQKDVDALYAEYQDQLAKMKQGYRFSKTLYWAGDTLQVINGIPAVSIQSNASDTFDFDGKQTGPCMISNVEVGTTVVCSDSTMTPEEASALYAPYAEFGIIYDAESNNLVYRGQIVRSFLDVRKTNGEPFSGGRFHGSMLSFGCGNEAGTVDIETVRDYSNPDADGYGKLIGIEVKNSESKED